MKNTKNIETGQFEYIVSQTSQGVLGQSLIILLMTLLLHEYGYSGMKTLYIWDICAAVLLTDRYLNCRRYCRNNCRNDLQQIRRSIQRYTANLFLSGLLWAFIFSQIALHTPKEIQYLLMAVSYGIAGAAIVTLGTIFRIYFLFVFPPLATLMAVFIFQGLFAGKIIALILLLGMGFLLYTAYKFNMHFQLMHEKTEQLRKTEMEALTCLGKAGEYRDAYTGDHVLRVGYSSYLLAKAAGFAEQDAETLMYASPLHDLGKIGIPDSILRKPGRLTEEERQVMNSHTRIGASILKHSQSRVMKMGKVVALSHHEKWDGSGFPDGLSGEDIPIEGRIVSICDVFDALISSRHYKNGWTDGEAIAYLRQSSGTHFDPDLVDMFIHNIPKIKDFSSLQNIELSHNPLLDTDEHGLTLIKRSVA